MRRNIKIIAFLLVTIFGVGNTNIVFAAEPRPLRFTSAEAAALGEGFFVDAQGNMFRPIWDTHIIMNEALVEKMLAQVGLRPQLPDGAVPAWHAAQFLNENRQLSQTNFALRDGLLGFYGNVVPYIENPFPWNWRIPILSESNLVLSEDFSVAILQAFNDDAFSRSLPFNYGYLALLLDDIDFYFAPIENRWYWNGYYFDLSRENYPYSGFFLADEGLIFIAMTREWTSLWGYSFDFGEKFSAIAIHEIGHVLGLGEALAHLLEEMYLGISAPSRLGIWERDTSFDRVLLLLAGHEAFWEAAFTSNEAYGNLWNLHLGHIISFEDLQMAKRVDTIARQNGNLVNHLEDIPNMFYRAFGPNISQNRRHFYILQTQNAVNQLNGLVEIHNLNMRPIDAVFGDNSDNYY